jgi:hypothetical protein
MSEGALVIAEDEPGTDRYHYHNTCGSEAPSVVLNRDENGARPSSAIGAHAD